MKTKNVNSEVKVLSAVTEKPAAGKSQPAAMDIILKKIETLENLRNYYSKLKVKKGSLEAALKKMKAFQEGSDDHFEENEVKEFPFEIILQGENEYNRAQEIFKINKRDTVTKFTEYLLSEVTQLLDNFEKEIQEFAQNFDR